MDFIPYCKLKDFEKNGNTSLVGNICFSHFRANIEPHVKAEVDLSIFTRWDKVYAGDLHSHSNSQLNIVYPGSPVTTSFHRNKVDTGMLILDSETTEFTWHKLHSPQLIRKTIQAGELMTATDYDHTIYEITGDIEELGSIEHSELIDKKIVKRVSECSLILDPKMSVLEELQEYLEYIVMLPQPTINEVLKEYNDNTKNT